MCRTKRTQSLNATLLFQVESIDDVKPVENITLLRNLNLLRNPIQGIANYRLSLLFYIPQLNELDRHRVEAEEKVGHK